MRNECVSGGMRKPCVGWLEGRTAVNGVARMISVVRQECGKKEKKREWEGKK